MQYYIYGGAILKLKQILFCALGILALILGSIGIVLPVLPTTPFVLLAGICFSIGSPRLHEWLKHTRHFGYYIQNYQSGTGIPRGVKRHTLCFLWFGLILSMVLAHKLWLVPVLLAVGIGVTIHIHCMKTSDE